MSEPYPTDADVAIRVDADEKKTGAGSLSGSEDAEESTSGEVGFVYPNMMKQQNWPLYSVRYWLREYLSEFLGTMLLVVYGNGVVATTTFHVPEGSTSEGMSQYLAVTFGWGAGLCVALYVSMGVSGGHLNPSVTVANAVFGTFPWRKVPGYCFSQILGAFVGAACVWGLFRNQFDAAEASLNELVRKGKSDSTMIREYGGIFCTYPAGRNGYAVYSELFNTALLLLGILGINDVRMTPAINFKPVAVGMLVFAIGISTGVNSGYAINPARDLGPRMFSAVVYGREAFTRNQYYFWIPTFIPFAGALLGVLIYVLLIIPTEL